ncbi:hypothetical protein BDC45DRAFT_576502 [Circinella umbellata]|nr:hypothetical protein BDC45DRAFT_576502 [Circinella umbellata]
MKLVIEHHLEQSYDLISSDICPACMFETHDENSSPLLVALDGNFSLRSQLLLKQEETRDPHNRVRPLKL